MEKKTSSQLKTENSKRKFLEHLSDSGNISFACKRTGISRETYYRWIDEDRPFSADSNNAIELGKSFINDLAHTQLVRNIQDGDMGAIKFHLSCCHPDYRAKLPVRPESIPEPIGRIEIYNAEDHPDIIAKREAEKEESEKTTNGE